MIRDQQILHNDIGGCIRRRVVDLVSPGKRVNEFARNTFELLPAFLQNVVYVLDVGVAVPQIERVVDLRTEV